MVSDLGPMRGPVIAMVSISLILTSVSLILTASSYSLRAQGSDVAPQDTPELKNLQSQYRIDVQDALRPVRERYIGQLQALVRSFTAKGNLPAAVAVQAEIDSVKNSPSEDVGSGKRITHKEIEKEVIGHWTYGAPNSWLGIRPDGKAYHEKAVMTWTVNAEKSVVLTDPSQPGKHATLVFDSRVESFTGTDFDGKRIAGMRRDRE